MTKGNKLQGDLSRVWSRRAWRRYLRGRHAPGTPTLVYCGACMSRTPSVVGAAISIVQGCPAEEGLAVARQSGPADVSPVLWAEVKAAIA